MNEILAKHHHAKIQLEVLDISDSKSIDEFVANIKQKYGQVDVLVNNAGVAAKGDEFDSAVVKFTFQTVMLSLFRITMELLNLLRKCSLS
jgi:NADP-dependent 3-hydroxy acid dehydrogenase YdfG